MALSLGVKVMKMRSEGAVSTVSTLTALVVSLCRMLIVPGLWFGLVYMCSGLLPANRLMHIVFLPRVEHSQCVHGDCTSPDTGQAFSGREPGSYYHDAICLGLALYVLVDLSSSRVDKGDLSFSLVGNICLSIDYIYTRVGKNRM